MNFILLSALALFGLLLSSCFNFTPPEFRAGEYVMNIPEIGVEAKLRIKQDCSWSHLLVRTEPNGKVTKKVESGIAKFAKNKNGFVILEFLKFTLFYDPLATCEFPKFEIQEYSNAKMYLSNEGFVSNESCGYIYSYTGNTVTPFH